MRGRNDDFDSSQKVTIMRLSPKVYKGNVDDYVADRRHETFLKDMCWWEKGHEDSYKKMLASDYVVCCLAEVGLTTRLLLVLKVIGPDPASYDDNNLHLIATIADGFEALNGKVLFRWGEKPQSSQAWKQDYLVNIKEVEAIDYGIPVVMPFTSYEAVRLTFNQMRAIYENDDPVWRSKLESVNAIYAIIDDETRRLYIGSTYSNDSSRGGIWNRWKCYVETGGHGNNTSLQEIADADPSYIERNFKWIILETLPLNIKSEKAVERENLYKEKFDTRKNGYNRN